jgi:hypothetical protein
MPVWLVVLIAVAACAVLIGVLWVGRKNPSAALRTNCAQPILDWPKPSISSRQPRGRHGRCRSTIGPSTGPAKRRHSYGNCDCLTDLIWVGRVGLEPTAKGL